MPAPSQPASTAMTGPHEPLLVVSPSAKNVHRLQRELKGSPYALLAATETQKALKLLGTQRVQLVILSQPESRRFAGEPIPKPTGRRSEIPAPPPSSTPPARSDLFEVVTTAAAGAEIPVLLIGSLWNESALAGGLETDADYFLFAPYQPADLLRAIRDTLLNGPVREPPEAHPGLVVIHEDRSHLVTAGRSRLARLGFSIFEELRQCRAALSWSQAEALELRRQLRQERQQSQQMLRSPAVVQEIAHDFANLLETVSAAATVLRSGPAQPKPYREALDAALAQAGVLLSTLQNWTEWDGEEGTPSAESVELNLITQEVLDAALLALRAPNIRVRLQLEGLPPVSASRPLMMRILSNLVWNAVEAMPDGGRLSLLGYLQRNRVVVEVSDTGVGMSKQEQEKIFRSHYSTKPGHAGMGLLLVHRLVRRAGGEISFVSNPGRGSTFALSFPVAGQYATTSELSQREGRSTIPR